MEIKVCIDVGEYDMVLLLQLARSQRMSLDVLIKRALIEYVEKLLAPSPTKKEGEQ
jgi:hypothetical protein